VSNFPDDFIVGPAEGVGPVSVGDSLGVAPVSVGDGVSVGVMVVGAGSGVTDVVGLPSRCTGVVSAFTQSARTMSSTIPITTDATTSGLTRDAPGRRPNSPATRVRIDVQRLGGVGSVTRPD
jgi:hypothetical protein